MAGSLAVSADVAREIEIEVKYEGFIRRQLNRAEKLRDLEETAIPLDFEYNIPGLSAEASEKLCRCRPRSLGQAARIPGVQAEDISLLLTELVKAQLSHYTGPNVPRGTFDEEAQ